MNNFTFFFSTKSSKCGVYCTFIARVNSDKPHFQVLNNQPHVAGGYCVRQHRIDSSVDSLTYLDSKVNQIKRKYKKRYKTNNKHTYEKNVCWRKERDQQGYVQMIRVQSPID